MDSSFGKGSYAEYRAQLLQRALEEKKKLGLDGSHASVKHSSALQALRCYGLESNDSPSFGEPEETVRSTRTNERRKTIDLHPKQTRVTSPYRKQQSLSPNSCGSGDKKDNKPLKSILKRTESPSDSPVTNKQHSPCGSTINTPFFLNNAENEAEFLYGKSIKEQSLRVSALRAENKSNSKSKSKVIDLNARNMKTSINLSDSSKNKSNVVDSGAKDSKASTNLSSGSKNKSSMVDSGVKDSKASTNLSGGSKNKSTAIDLFAQDSKISTSHSSNSKRKNSSLDFDAQNLKTSSNLFGYAALLNFSKSGPKVQPKTKNASGSGSSQKDDSSREKKTSKPAGALNDNPTGTNLYSPNKKTAVAKSVADKNNDAPLSNPTQVSKSKPVARLLPRSIQKLQTKKFIDHSVDRKGASSEATAPKVSSKGVLHISAGNDLSKNSEKAEKCNVKSFPKKSDTSLKNDEMLLLKYVQRTTRSTGEKIKPGSAMKTPAVQKESPEEKNKSAPLAPVTLKIKDYAPKPFVNAASAVQRPESSTGLKIKSGAINEPTSVSTKECESRAAVNTTTIQALKKEIPFPNKKHFLSKLSSIKQRKKNFSFLYHGKRPPPKDLLAKRPLKRPRGTFDPKKGYGQIAKGKRFSKQRHSFNFGSEKMAYVGREVRNKGTYEESSLVHDTGRTPLFQKPDEAAISGFDNGLRSVSAKNTRKYNYISPDMLSADRNAVGYTEMERHGSRSDLSPKRESFYRGHNHEAFGRNSDRYSFEKSPQRHSVDWSPSRNEFHNSPRRHSLEDSPGRYSFDGSPKRQPLDRSPVRHSFNESLGPRPFDRSPSPNSFSRSPGQYSYRSPEPDPYDRSPEPDPYDRSPEPDPYDRSLDSHSYDRSPDSHPYDRSPDHHPYNRSPAPFLYDRSPSPDPYVRSPGPHEYDRSPGPHEYDRSPDSHPYDSSSRFHSYDVSPEPESHDMDSGRHLQEMSPRRHTFDRRHRVDSFDNSSERLSVNRSPRRLSDERDSRRLSIDMSPRRLSLDRSPLRLSIDRSPRRLSNDRNSRQLSIDRSSGRLSAERSPRRVPFDRQSRNNSFDCSPGRLRKSRLDCYHDSPGGISCRSPRKESRESLKHHPRSKSPEAMLFDSSDRLSERSLKSNRSDLSQNLNTRAPLIRQQVDLMNNPCVEGYSNLSLETKIPSALDGISQQQDLHNILGTNIVIPDVNKIVNAIDNLASNYTKSMVNEKTYGISQGHSLQSFNSASPMPHVQDPTQLPTPSSTVYPAAYQQSCYNQTNNNPQFASYNNEIPQASYPPYNVSSADSYSSQYPTAFHSQSSDTASLYPAASSTFCSPGVAPLPYSNGSIGLPPFSSASAQPPFNSASVQAAPFNTGTAQTPFSNASVVSSTFSGGGAVAPFSTSSLMQQSSSTADELSEMYPGADPNYIVNDGSLERISTLTAVPLQSDELAKKNTNKSQISASSAVTMKFITPDKIEKLLRQKSDIRKQMASLNNEHAKLQKMQGDAMRRKRREKDGHKDTLLLEYGKLQEEIKSHINNLVDNIKDIEQELRNGFLGCTSEKEARKEHPTSKGDNEKGYEKTGECDEETEESSSYHEFYDSGSHWCKQCNKLSTTISGMLEHLKSEEHIELSSLIDKPWVSKLPNDEPIKNEQKGRKIAKPVKGVEFIMPIDGFYCSLCKEYFEKNSHIQDHLKSSRHHETYQNYTAENPEYERRWLLDRLAGLSIIEIEENKRFSQEEKLLQKKQKKDKEEKKWKEEEGEKVRQKEEEEEKEKFRQDKDERFKQKEEEERLRQKEEEKRLRQKEEEKMNMKEKSKYKEEGKKRYIMGEEGQMEDDENFRHRMDVVEKLNRRKEEKKSFKHSKEQREEFKHREEDEKKWVMSCRKQEEEKLKRKKDEEKEASNKKLRITNVAEEEEDTQSTGNSKGIEVTDDEPVEKLSKAEAKWTVYDGPKKLPFGKGSEPKSKPKQTVVYIGRAPNFKSYNKGNSSFRANLLKLALQKKESDSNSNKDNEVTPTSSGINCVTNTSSPVNTSTSESVKPNSSEQGTITQRTGNTESASDAISISNISSSLHATDQQIILSQSFGKNETNSNCEQQNCGGIISNPYESNYTSSANNTESLHKTSIVCESTFQQNISVSSNAEAYNCVNADLNRNQASVSITTFENSPQVLPVNSFHSMGYESCNTQQMKENISSSVPSVTNVSSNPVNHCNWPIKTGSEKSFQQRKAKRQVPAHGPLTEEDEDLRLLGIDREDRLPLVLPKPPPAALIRSCHKDDKNTSAEVLSGEIAPVTSDSDVSKMQSPTDKHNAISSQCYNESYSQGAQPITKTAQIVASPSDMSSSHQNYGYVYDSSMAHQQNVNYSQNAQTNFAAPREPVNCTNTSNMQHSRTYPYNSNAGNVNNFQGNFMMPSEHINEMTVSPFHAAQGPPPGQFQNLPSRMGYGYQGAPPPQERYNQSPGNFGYGGYPQNRFPPPNVNPCWNYCPQRFQRGFGQRARMPRPTFKNKWRFKQNQMAPNVDDRKKPAVAGKELPSQVKAEKPPAGNTTSDKSGSPKTIGVDGCVGNSSSETVAPKGAAVLTVSENEKSGSFRMLDHDCESSDRNAVARQISKAVDTQKSLSGGSGCDMSNCAKLQEGCTFVEQNKVPIQNKPTVDLEIASCHVNVHSTKLERHALSPMAELNDSQQPLSFDSSAVATQVITSALCGVPVSNLCENSVNGTTEIKVDQGVDKKCIDSFTVEKTEAHESTGHAPAVSDGGVDRTCEGTSYQNQPSEQKVGEDTPLNMKSI